MYRLSFLMIGTFVLVNNLVAQWQQSPILDPFYKASIVPKWHDLDGDGLPDIINYDAENQLIFWNKNLDGTFGPSNIIQSNIELKDEKILVQDYDFDGDLDLIGDLSKSFGEDYYWSLMSNDGEGNFTTQEYRKPKQRTTLLCGG